MNNINNNSGVSVLSPVLQQELKLSEGNKDKFETLNETDYLSSSQSSYLKTHDCFMGWNNDETSWDSQHKG